MSRALTRVLLPLALMLLTSLALAAPIAAQEPEPTGSVTVNKFDDLNENGTWDEGEPPLADACFELWPAGTEASEPAYPQRCTDATGQTVFEEVAKGDYSLEETSPPPGYQYAPPMFVTVGGGEGEDTEENLNPVVDVPNYPAPPPMGGLEVNKYDCTQVEEPEITIWDPAPPEPPVPAEAPGTCGLHPNAEFIVEGDALEEPIVLVTNVFGYDFTELPEGAYTISETEPNEVGPVAFTIDCDEEMGCDFVFALALNPLECSCETVPPVIPAVSTATPAAGPLPNTADTDAALPIPALAMLAVVGVAFASLASLNVVSRRRR